MARGSLRIYLGAAPGVGKTYKMLGEGVRRAERGTDVAVGLVETHGRIQTAEQIHDLDVMPRREIEYRDTVLHELDVDAILARRPEVVLVDEYAHTNAPGSRNEKRWQDIEQLLDAGIDVISTLNIQHLESLNDVIKRITGTVQRETVPDDIVRRADQLELVDMAPEAIRRRMAHGNIYPPERVDAALANYFRPGNLGALREFALLWVADRVEESLTGYLDAHGISEPWETRERVVVGLTGMPAVTHSSAARRAWPAASAASSSGFTSPSTTACRTSTTPRSPRNASSSVELGGTVHDIVAPDTAEAMASFARREKATQLVLGASRRSRWHELVHGSFVARVTRLAPDIDVHVIARTESAEPEHLPAPATAVVASAHDHRMAARDRRPAGVRRPDRAVPRLDRSVDGTAARARRRAGHRRDRRTVRRNRRRRLRVAARQLVLRSALRHVHDRTHREPDLPGRVHRRRGRGRSARRPGHTALARRTTGPAWRPKHSCDRRPAWRSTRNRSSDSWNRSARRSTSPALVSKHARHPEATMAGRRGRR